MNYIFVFVGYDLKQLFIGSEGTLGIITGLSLMAPQRPLVSSLRISSLINIIIYLEDEDLNESREFI